VTANSRLTVFEAFSFYDNKNKNFPELGIFLQIKFFKSKAKASMTV